MFSGNYPSLSDIAAVTDGDKSGFGGNGAWILILLLVLFGGFNRGFNGAGSDNNVATAADLQRGFNNQEVMDKLNGFENAFAQLGYDQLGQMNAINANISTTGFGIQNAIQQTQISQMQGNNAIQSQIADCCCKTQRAIDGVNYNLSQGFCGVNNTINNGVRDIIENQNNNARQLHDEIVSFRMQDMQNENENLRAQLNSANLAQSQSAQSAYLVGQLRPTPIPAYPVANPYAYTPCAQTCTY